VVELLESLARAHGALGELLQQKEYLERALAEGRLTWARVNQALARVLE